MISQEDVGLMPRRPAKSSGAQAERSAADGGDGRIDVMGRRKIGSKALDFKHFSAFGCFEQVGTVNALRELIHGGTTQKV